MIVTCKCYGRFGNNLFQIAAAIGYAKTHGYELRIPKVFAHPEYKDFFAHLPIFNPAPGGPDIIHNFYNEPKHTFVEIPKMRNPELNGYFQTEKYFAHARTEVLQAFWDNRNDETIDKVAIHIRRGDYLFLQNQFPVLPMSYFIEAMNRFSGSEFLIFSDDIEWARENFIGPQFSFSRERDPIEDLFLMARCKHQIISNSSYSWWAAWLNKYEFKKVIAPSIWFGPANVHLDTSDVIPENWERIQIC
jgi:hypothetical protein